MYYKIQKTLGDVAVVQTDCIVQEGFCIEFKNFNQRDASILVYTNGNPEDLNINGWTFPCVYNDIVRSNGGDTRGGDFSHEISFELLDPMGDLKNIEDKTLYGTTEPGVIKYFYSLLYNISCCANMKQFEHLYTFIIDNGSFYRRKKRSEAISVLNFIEEFTPQLARVEENEFVEGLKRKIDIKFKEAQEIIASSNAPV